VSAGGAREQPGPRYTPWYTATVALFVTSLITANIISVKLISLGPLVVPAGILIFPVSYITGDVLTEVYGYREARRVIWLGFCCNALAVAAVLVAGGLHPAPFWKGQEAYQQILGFTPRLLAASFAAYLVGEFLNAYVMARLKIATHGRWLWSRTMGSTLVGQAADSLVFISLAFGGFLPLGVLMATALTQWAVKCAYEALATPLTYAAVSLLKRKEGRDAYDLETRFSPLPFLCANKKPKQL